MNILEKLPVEDDIELVIVDENPKELYTKKLNENSVQSIKSIAAIMVHVPDWKEGLAWYQKAFPEAKFISLPEFDFECLQLKGINIEGGRRMCKLKDPFGNLLGLRGP